MTYDAQSLTLVAHALADAAREAILPHFRQSTLSAENKLVDGFDPVTIADKDAEQAMRQVLADQRPQDSILGEEFGHHLGSSGLTWVLDPIDGTRGFLAGTPTWGVLIAVGDEDGPILGMIDQPYIGERFWGSQQQAFCTGPLGQTPIQTRAARPLNEAILFTTFPEVGTEADRRGFEAVAEHVRLVRYGMDCYAYALLAAGQIDLVIEAGLQSYDIQGPIGVIQAAGGLVTDWSGNPVHNGGQVLAAANAEIHAVALDILRKSS
ncbi:MAG: histidinol-phosphatase [Paracoccaceae bacterium]